VVSHGRVINGILFRERTGIPWRDLPERFGRWKTIHERHRRWSADGTWDRILQAVQADAEGGIDWGMVGVYSTSCRAHQHAADARRKTPRTPKKEPRPGSTAPTRDSEGPGAA
jgi:transposase